MLNGGVLHRPRDLVAWVLARITGPGTTLVTPTPHFAHLLRRDAHRTARPALVAGLRVHHPHVLAHDLLVRAGTVTTPSLHQLRALALRTRLEGGPALEYLNDLAVPRTYADAVADTIADLESAGLTPAHLRAAAAAPDAVEPRRLLDVATLWEAVDTELRAADPTLRSAAGLLLEAADAVAGNPDLVRPFGRILVVLPLTPSPALVDFVAALQPAAVAVPAARPERVHGRRFLDRLQTRLDAPLAPDDDAPPPRTECDILRAYLFDTPERLAAPDRPRSTGPDGTVVLERHAGVQHEVDAAVAWVVEEIADRRTPLEEIALVVPARDPYVSLLVAALERTDKAGAVPAFVAGGLPLTDAPAGARLLALLDAVAEHLECERTIALLPHLRLARDVNGGRHLSDAHVREIVYGSGIVGGTPGHPERAREWAPRLRARAASLTALLARLDGDAAADEPERARASLRRRDAERMVEHIGAILPAVEALAAVADAVLAGTPLPDLWARILDFHREWTLVPPLPPDAARVLDDAVRPLCAHPAGATLAGRDAAEQLRRTLRGLRHPHGRFGEPRVFVGTPADAAPLRFGAVRLLGAVEGVIPRAPYQDAILPDAAREALERWRPAALLPTSADRVLRETQEAALAVAAATTRVALGAPRHAADGTEHELAGLMLEAAVALGRPDPAATVPEPVPSLAALERVYVAPGTAARAARDAEQPVAVRAALRGVTRVPPSWLEPADGVRSLARFAALAARARDARLGVADGFLGDGAAALGLPALSASALDMLLSCAHRFLLERLLHLRAPVTPPPAREIGQPHYGSLLHRVMERFFREHGAAFCRRDGGRDWHGELARVADACFVEFLGEYPLAGDGAAETQRKRLQRDVAYLLRAEREGPRLTYVGVEVPFGYPEPVELRVDGGRALRVRGFIDRLDGDGTGAVIRDIKSGRPKPRDEEPVAPWHDAQIALYALVAPALAGTRRVSRAAYVYPSAVADAERAFAGEELDALLADARRWFGLAAELLDTRSFPHAVEADRCRYCDFRPVCGDDAPERAAGRYGAAPAGHLALRWLDLQGTTVRDDDD